MWRVKERKKEKNKERSHRRIDLVAAPHKKKRTVAHAAVRSPLLPPTPPPLLPSQSAGQAFRCKGVQRSYAFGDATVPRAPTQYLKVVDSTTPYDTL